MYAPASILDELVIFWYAHARRMAKGRPCFDQWCFEEAQPFHMEWIVLLVFAL